MARLYILRHGKTELVSATGIDFDRNLVQRGERNSTQIGRMIADHMPKPQLIIFSPANRTRQTAELVMREVPDADSIEDRRIYNAEGETLFDVITDHGFDYERVMIIGHNPGLIVLMHLLMAEDGNRGSHSIVDFPSASFAEMVFEPDTFGQVNLDTGVLMRLLRPREMTTTGA